MAKGGYQIIDFKGTNFTVGTAVKIAGVHEAIEGNYHKSLLLENFSIEGVEQTAAWVSAAVADASYTLAGTGLSGRTITVTNTDEITINAAGA